MCKIWSQKYLFNWSWTLFFLIYTEKKLQDILIIHIWKSLPLPLPNRCVQHLSVWHLPCLTDWWSALPYITCFKREGNNSRTNKRNTGYPFYCLMNSWQQFFLLKKIYISYNVFFLTFKLFVSGALSIRLTSSSIPSHAIRNDRVELVCNYDMEGDKLYSVKWSVVGIFLFHVFAQIHYFG